MRKWIWKMKLCPESECEDVNAKGDAHQSRKNTAERIMEAYDELPREDREYGEKHGIPVVDIPIPKWGEKFENQLPEWASSNATYGLIQRMQQLYTKQARNRGNATIAEITYNIARNCPFFIVATDAGNIIKCTYGELLEMFMLGEYILKEFPNPLIKERLEEMGE